MSEQKDYWHRAYVSNQVSAALATGFAIGFVVGGALIWFLLK